jgi:hypothetical protein
VRGLVMLGLCLFKKMEFGNVGDMAKKGVIIADEWEAKNVAPDVLPSSPKSY